MEESNTVKTVLVTETLMVLTKKGGLHHVWYNN